MSQENLEAVRRFFNAYNRSDLEATLDLLGREAWSEFWHTFREAWESFAVTVERMACSPRVGHS
jgi:hypothetical protein